jgi:hypothetical protein
MSEGTSRDYRLGVLGKVLDDDEFGGLTRSYFFELWRESRLPDLAEVNDVARRAALAREDPSSLGLKDVIEVDMYLGFQRQRRIPKVAGKLATYFGLEWRNITLPAHITNVSQ